MQSWRRTAPVSSLGSLLSHHSYGPGDYVVLAPVTAGDGRPRQCTSGSVVRITTGAPVPTGADAVVQVRSHYC